MPKYMVMISKAKQALEFDSDTIMPDDPEEQKRIKSEIFREGLKVVLNRGMAKIATAGLEGDELVKAQAEALAKAQENAENLQSGKVRFVGGTKKKAGDRAITTEARRIAREAVKQALKENGEKVSHYSAKAITEAADAFIQENDWVVEQAKENLAKVKERHAKIDISTMRPDPVKVKAAETAKAKKKGSIPLSKLQAGKPVHRANA